ncbi:hypothetical protein [Stenotrophomonas muris]|uniref:hypothetical protein n=1 Tax=Stenotrophomonas muris TaxID=2963283 RepID=UPI003207C51A
MTVKFFTDKPSALLAKFKAKIEIGNGAGGISSWTFKDGAFYHKADELIDGAKVVAVALPSDKYPHLQFNVNRIGDKNVSTHCYTELHGNLIATFIKHFSKDFTSAGVLSAYRKKS